METEVLSQLVSAHTLLFVSVVHQFKSSCEPNWRIEWERGVGGEYLFLFHDSHQQNLTARLVPSFDLLYNAHLGGYCEFQRYFRGRD